MESGIKNVLTILAVAIPTQNIKKYRTILRHQISACGAGIKNIGLRLRRFAGNDTHSNVIDT
ncbi:hypothetical protein QUB70_14235 [Microcoleus sp. A003_D6]